MFDCNTPEQQPTRVRWMTGPEIVLTDADEQFVDQVVHELADWREPSVQPSVGSVIRTELQLAGVAERVKITIDELDAESQFVVTFKVRISRSGMPDTALHVHYGYGGRANVLGFAVLPD
jgi:hypothetical protein